MTTVGSSGPRIESVRVTKDEIVVRLVDGRTLRVPLAWSWRLAEATAAERARFRLIGNGQGVHWPDVDEDMSVESLLAGTPARRPKSASAPKAPRVMRGAARRKRSSLGRKRAVRR